MIKHPGKIIMKIMICVCMIGVMIYILQWSLRDSMDQREYSSTAASLTRLEQLCERGQFDRFSESITCGINLRQEAYAPSWELEQAYLQVCDYEVYAHGLRFLPASIADSAWTSRAGAIQKQSHDIITGMYEAGTYPQNEKILKFFLSRTE